MITKVSENKKQQPSKYTRTCTYTYKAAYKCVYILTHTNITKDNKQLNKQQLFVSVTAARQNK